MKRSKEKPAKAPKKSKETKARVLPSSPTDWVLMRSLGTRTALAAIVLAAAVGLLIPYALPLAALIALTFLAFSFVMLLFLLQRVVFGLRFESGPRRFDVPNKATTLRYVALLFLPAFVFTTAFQLKYAIVGGLASSQADIAVQQFLDLSQPTSPTLSNGKATGWDIYNTGSAAAPTPTTAVRRQFLDELAKRQTERLAQAKAAIAPMAIIWGWGAGSISDDLDRLASERTTSWSGTRAALDRQDQRAQATAASKVNTPSAGRASSPPASSAPAAPTATAPLSSEELADNQTLNSLPLSTLQCFEGDSRPACQVHHDLQTAAAGRWSLGLGNMGDTGVIPLIVLLSEFLGLFLFVVLVFTAAILLRVARLSDGATPYVIVGVSAMITAAISVSLIGGDFNIPYSTLWFSTALPLVALAAAGMAFIPALRPDGLIGFVRRQIVVLAPVVLAAIVAIPLSSQIRYDGSPAVALITGAFALVLAGVSWIAWVIFDRGIVRANCRPKAR